MTQRRKRYDKRLKVAAARVVPSGEMRAVDLAKELGAKDSALRRWAQEYGEMGDAAFPGNGSPKVSKDCEIVRPRKKAGELERENGLLKKIPGLLGSRPCARCGSIKAHRGEFGPIMRAGINIVGTRGLRTKI